MLKPTKVLSGPRFTAFNIIATRIKYESGVRMAERKTGKKGEMTVEEAGQ